MEVTIHLDTIVFQGRLQGFGGGNVNRGTFRLTTTILDLENGDELASDTVHSQTENGSFLSSEITLPDNVFNPMDSTLVAEVEAGREYVVWFQLDTEASGINSEADFMSGGFHARVGCYTFTNDVEDVDGDGLPDEWEEEGVDGVDLPAMGAGVDRKDLFLELDWVTGREPRRAAVAAVKESFLAAPVDAGGVTPPSGSSGVRLWVDAGDLTDDAASEDGAGVDSCGDGIDNGGDGVMDDQDPDCLVGDLVFSSLAGGGGLGEGGPVNGIPNGVNIPLLVGDDDGNGVPDFYEVRALNFEPSRSFVFHYAISAPPRSSEDGGGDGSCSDGIDNGGDGLTDSEDMLDCFGGGQAEFGGNDLILMNLGGGTLMHELGHNLGLHHGGDAEDNCKPNYVSIMNYDHSGGIYTTGGPGTGQDLDGDGLLDGRLLDFSPPRFVGGRGQAPLTTIREDDLDDSLVLDPMDSQNQFAFVDADGVKRRQPLDVAADWGGVEVNVDTVGESGQPRLCANGVSDSVLTGHDDWTNLVFAFQQFGDAEDGPIDPVTDPEPTTEDLERLNEELNTADLELSKTHEPERAVAGQELIYRLTVTNHGPNPASEVVLMDTLPAEVVYLADSAGCEEVSPGMIECDLGELLAGEERSVEIVVRVSLDLPCEAGKQTMTIVNTASVDNLAGPDPRRRNNIARDETEVLCLRYEYAAELLCGVQSDPSDLRLARGLYATTVSIHNPHGQEVSFFKKVAVAFPPVEQAPGEIFPIAVDTLGYDESLKSDCNEIRESVLRGESSESPYVIGWLVVQSPEPLDVSGIYSTAALNRNGVAKGHSSLEIERIPERERTVKADVEVIKRASFRPSQNSTNSIHYSVEVINHGPAASGEILLTDHVEMIHGQLLSVPESDFTTGLGAGWGVESVDPEGALLVAKIPNLSMGESALLEFSILVIVDPSVGDTRVVNTASAEIETEDYNPENNTDTVETTLNLE